jgi:hypothetical protein
MFAFVGSHFRCRPRRRWYAAQAYQQHCANKCSNNLQTAMLASKIIFQHKQVFHNHPVFALAGVPPKASRRCCVLSKGIVCRQKHQQQNCRKPLS